MPGMLSYAAVVLFQKTTLWGCGHMQRHRSGRQRGRAFLWLPSCHLWAGSWPWNSLWYNVRPGIKQMKITLIKIVVDRRRGSAPTAPPTHVCTEKTETWKSFTSKENSKTLLVNVLLMSLITRAQGDHRWISPVIPAVRLSITPPLHYSCYRLERGQPSGVQETFRVQLELLCLCSQTVFPFILSLRTLFILVLFYTTGPDWAGERKHLTDFQSDDMTAGWGFLWLSKIQIKGQNSL